MQIKKVILMAGALALLTGTGYASGWSSGNMPWGSKGDAPWSRDNMPWGGKHRSMPWQGRRGGWSGNKGWEDWTPWGKGHKSPWNSSRWGNMPWSNDHKRKGFAPPYGYGYGQAPGYRMPPRGQMMPNRPPMAPQQGQMPPRGPMMMPQRGQMSPYGQMMGPRGPRGGMGSVAPGRPPQARPPVPRPPAALRSAPPRMPVPPQ